MINLIIAYVVGSIAMILTLFGLFAYFFSKYRTAKVMLFEVQEALEKMHSEFNVITSIKENQSNYIKLKERISELQLKLNQAWASWKKIIDQNPISVYHNKNRYLESIDVPGLEGATTAILNVLEDADTATIVKGQLERLNKSIEHSEQALIFFQNFHTKLEKNRNDVGASLSLIKETIIFLEEKVKDSSAETKLSFDELKEEFKILEGYSKNLILNNVFELLKSIQELDGRLLTVQNEIRKNEDVIDAEADIKSAMRSTG